MTAAMQVPNTTWNPGIPTNGVNAHNRVADAFGTFPYGTYPLGVPVNFGAGLIPNAPFGTGFGAMPASIYAGLTHPFAHPAAIQAALAYAGIPMAYANPYNGMQSFVAPGTIHPFLGQNIGTIGGYPTISPFGVNPLSQVQSLPVQTFGSFPVSYPNVFSPSIVTGQPFGSPFAAPSMIPQVAGFPTTSVPLTNPFVQTTINPFTQTAAINPWSNPYVAASIGATPPTQSVGFNPFTMTPIVSPWIPSGINPWLTCGTTPFAGTGVTHPALQANPWIQGAMQTPWGLTHPFWGVGAAGILNQYGIHSGQVHPAIGSIGTTPLGSYLAACTGVASPYRSYGATPFGPYPHANPFTNPFACAVGNPYTNPIIASSLNLNPFAVASTLNPLMQAHPYFTSAVHPWVASCGTIC